MTTTTDVATPALPDDRAHEDGRLMHELTEVNTMIARYVVRFLDADAGRTEPASASDEHALANRLTCAAEAICARATIRARNEQP